MDGKAFRQAVRRDHLGEDHAERVYRGPQPSPSEVPSGIANFCKEITARLGEASKEASAKGSTVKGFTLISIVSEHEKEAEDFGEEEAEVVVRETTHSFVDESNGNVYLPAVDGSGPAKQHGARCNVCNPSSYSYALGPAGLMLPFQGHARILLELGVNVDSADAWGETSLMYACSMLKESTVDWLLSKGADPTRKTIGSKATALHRAVEAQGSDSVKAAIIRKLVKHKGDPNAQNSWGVTPLHIAALLRLPDTIKALIESGASSKVQDWRGRLPAEFCLTKQTDSDAKKKEVERLVSMLKV